MATATALIQPDALARLVPVLAARGYRVFGPVVRDAAIVYEPIERWEELALGWSADTAPGRYRLKHLDDGRLFVHPPGPQSLKNHLHPPEARLVEAHRDNGAFRIIHDVPLAQKRAFLGVRPCEVAAVLIQDRVLIGDRYTDSVYQARRKDAFLVVVNCGGAAPTCFCASMNTGPRAESGVDIALTELSDPHEFCAEAGSEAGREILAELERSPVTAAAREKAAAASERARSMQQRHVDTAGLPQALYANFESPRWEQIAARCLSCANCTMVCPTCFCVTVDDTSDLGVRRAERWRRWDSCFTQSFSYIHGGSVRQSPRSRYRQWLTHKFAAWPDQFGSFGCTGCGRCITWCPAGIDITEELAAITNGTTGQPDNRPTG